MYYEALLLEKLEQMMGVGKWRHIMASEISEHLGKEMEIEGEM
jgi:hypothetical protein